MVKMIFNRKNKKVSSIFRTKTNIQLLYEKYISYRKMENDFTSSNVKTNADSSKKAHSSDFTDTCTTDSDSNNFSFLQFKEHL